MEFTKTTGEIVAEEGFAGYCPTLYHDEDLLVIEGIPDEVDHRDALHDMVRRHGLIDKEFMFGVRSGPDEIVTGHIRPDGSSFMSVCRVDGQIEVREQPEPAWWQPARELRRHGREGGSS